MSAKRTLRFVIVIVALTGFFMTLLGTRAAAPKTAPNSTVPQQQIEKLLKHHEGLQLDAAQAARQVRESGRLLLATPTQSFELELTPHDLRAANYRAEEVTAG